MTQEDKELLLKDLSSRLSYGVICDCLHDYHTKASAVDAEDLTVYYPYCDEWEPIEYCKPYLHSMSNMTEEEISEYKHFVALSGNPVGSANFIDWLNSHHLDYRGLIEKGLAIAVTPDNNPYKV
jgi:hypothetical protein